MSLIHKYVIRSLIISTVLIGFIGYLSLSHVANQMVYAEELLDTFGPICAKNAVRDFQTEDITMFSDGGTGMSVNYNDYIGWLMTSGGDFGTTPQDLINNWSLGITATNYALPYLDPDKLQEKFDLYLKTQSQLLSRFNSLCPLTDMQGEVVSCTKQVYSMSSNYSLWGNSSSFNTEMNNHLGYELYNYDYFIAYKVKFRVRGKLELKVPVGGFTLKIPTMYRDVEFNTYYELVN